VRPQAEVARLDLERLAHREEGIEDDLLRNDPDCAPCVPILRAHVVSHHRERSRIDERKTAERGDERGLSRAVGTEEPEELAARDLERDARKRAHRAEALFHGAYL